MKTAVHVSTNDVSTCTSTSLPLPHPTPPHPTPPHPTPTPTPPPAAVSSDPNSKMTGQHSVSPEQRVYRWVVGLLCLPCVSLSPVHYLLMMIPIIFPSPLPPSPLPPLPSLTHLPDQLRAVVSCLTGHLGSLVRGRLFHFNGTSTFSEYTLMPEISVAR